MARPIISCANSPAECTRGSRRPVTRPARKIVAVSHNSLISSSLWEMNRIAIPFACNLRSVSNNRSTLCGGSTDVGSSRIRSLGSSSRQRMISTRWRSPTDSAWTIASGSTFSPNSSPSARMRRARSALRPGTIRAMFCTTLSVSNRLKCWNTIPIPSRRASAGLDRDTGRPCHRIAPSSGVSTP
jgi:hypothetical protein